MYTTNSETNEKSWWLFDNIISEGYWAGGRRKVLCLSMWQVILLAKHILKSRQDETGSSQPVCRFWKIDEPRVIPFIYLWVRSEWSSISLGEIVRYSSKIRKRASATFLPLLVYAFWKIADPELNSMSRPFCLIWCVKRMPQAFSVHQQANAES